jgi:hypothetical protein
MLRQEQKMHKQNMENLAQISAFEKTLYQYLSKVANFFKRK